VSHAMSARTLMVLGSMSSAGKSLVVTGLCRLFARRGLRVVPFKAQNMSNNAAVCAGGEIGRAQAVQAHASGIEPSVDMNPVLIKPLSDQRGQVILHGRIWDTLAAADYSSRREQLWTAITGSLDTLRSSADLVIIEGAGSPAELNLRQGDIVNMAVAHHAEAPCLLVGDIDRGGVFAQLLGTLWLLEPEDRARVRGLIVNRFRGDPALFVDGVQILEQRGEVPVIGVLPWIHDVGIADEDAAALGENIETRADAVQVAVVHLPHVANFDDVDPLRLETGVQVRFVRRPQDLAQAAAIVLPGTKNTLGDLEWLHANGLARAIRAAAERGVSVVGLCGGYQMMGRRVVDAKGVEAGPGSGQGLGLLPVETFLEGEKTVTRSQATILANHGSWRGLAGLPIAGYEIHMGRTATDAPLVRIQRREGAMVDAPDGAMDATGRVFGTYLHGLFDNDSVRRSWLRSIGVQPGEWTFEERRLAAYDRLADVFEASLDVLRLDRIVGLG
jgi:adenosylcobyric acid synthase